MFDNRVGNKVYGKDSMDRFGDDLTELILSYLWFEDKIRYECVSKQWQRCVFQKQFIFEIDFCLDKSPNSLNKLCFHFDKEVIVSVLKKCPNITKVKVSDLNLKYDVLSLFGHYCPHIKSLLHNNKGIVYFYRKNGHKLEELILLTNRSNNEIKNLLKFCPNLKIFYSNNISVLLNEDKEFLPKLEQISNYFEIIPEYVNKMQILVNKYSKTIKRFDVRFSNISSEELKTCIDCISRFENLKSLALDFRQMKIEEPIDDCLSLIGQKCNKLLKLDLRIHESIPISNRFFKIFSEFKAIKKLKIELLHNTVLSGSVESFKHCKQLNELDITYPKLKEDFFTNIQLFVPKLLLLRIETRERFSDSFIYSFLPMERIEKIILFHKIISNINNQKYYYFGKCLSEVMLSPKRNDVIRIAYNCGLLSYN